MQRTIRVLKIALPIAIVVFIAVIVLSFNSTKTGRDRAAQQPVIGSRGNEQTIIESRVFEDVQTIGGKVVARIRARRVVGYASGWTTLENADLTLYRANGLTYEVSCPAAQFNSETKEAEAKGGVRVVSSDGIEIKTAEIRYDGSRLTNDIPVQFRVDRWNGNAGALDLDVQGETLRLFKNVTATMTPANPADPPMAINAVDSMFRRRENLVTFTRNVAIDRGADKLRADVVNARFTPDRKSLTGFEGTGHAQMVMSATAAPGEDLGGRKTIDCENFYTELGPTGQIAAINARGGPVAPAHAVLDGPPQRDIVAQGFRVGIENKAVSEIKADWQVVMKELGAEPRQIESEHVTVWFDPAAHRARAAYLEGAFKYTDAKTTASAFRANYDIVNDRIVLTTDPGWQAMVVSDGQTIKAKTIEFAPRAQTARASGEVIAQLASKKSGPTADSTNLFPAGKPVFVNSDQLTMRQAEKTAVFSGRVRAWQETNTILANELQLYGNGDSITARGNVRTLLYNTGTDPSAAARKTPMESTSEQLVARKGERRIDLLGKVTIVDETRTLKSEKASFFLDEARKIQRVEAETNVSIVEAPTQRKGNGDRAVYHVDKRMVYVFGSPATVSDPTGSVAGQQIVFDLTRNKVQVVSPAGQTKGTYKHEG
ncbi:MAG TPA: LPS export ABC transporter periplasmic protein LptC [Thermoanaerobaculia bacterium]|jgi:lipopolysaccharide transport protein LptA/LPS export ABC transporter protein LptC